MRKYEQSIRKYERRLEKVGESMRKYERRLERAGEGWRRLETSRTFYFLDSRDLLEVLRDFPGRERERETPGRIP